MHGRDDEPLGERVQDRAEGRGPEREHSASEQIHERLVEGRMSDAIDRATEWLDWQRAAVICNGDSIFAPQQNTDLRLRFVRDLIDDGFQQLDAPGRMRLFAAYIHGRPPPNCFESFEDRDAAARCFVGHVGSLPPFTR